MSPHRRTRVKVCCIATAEEARLAEVPRPGGAVRRQPAPAERGGRVEHQQHAAGPHAEEDVPPGLAGDHRQAHHAGVERLGGGEVGGVHGRFHDGLDRRGGGRGRHGNLFV